VPKAKATLAGGRLLSGWGRGQGPHPDGAVPIVGTAAGPSTRSLVARGRPSALTDQQPAQRRTPTHPGTDQHRRASAAHPGNPIGAVCTPALHADPGTPQTTPQQTSPERPPGQAGGQSLHHEHPRETYARPELSSENSDGTAYIASSLGRPRHAHSGEPAAVEPNTGSRTHHV
jgi:hypothetical protein